MIYHVVALLVIACVVVFGCARKASVYSPLIISAVIWFLVFSVGIFFDGRFESIKEDALIAWFLWFFISSVVYFLFLPKNVLLYDQVPMRRLPIDYSLLLVALIGWIIYRIWIVGNTGPSHFFLNLRLSSNGLEGYEPLGLIARFYPIVFALFIFEHIYVHPENRRLRVLCWIWMLLYGVATMGKFAILTPVVTWSVIRGIQGQLPTRKIIWLMAATFFLMMVAHFVRAGAEDESSLGDVLGVYIYSPLVALGFMDTSTQIHEFGAYVFRFLYAVGYWMNISSPPVDVILPYVEVPELTNVYTVMQPFFHDFGLWGVAVGALFYGVVFGVGFNFARRFGGLSLGIYSGLIIVLIGQFFGELFLTNFSGNLQQLMALIFVFSLSQKRIKNVN